MNVGRWTARRLSMVGIVVLAAAAPGSATIRRISNGLNGQSGNEVSLGPYVSADGRFVAFQGTSSNLVVGDTNGHSDVFVHDLVTHTTERVSVATGGAQGNSDSYVALISGDGQTVVFGSNATNLAPGGSHGGTFAHDRATGETTFLGSWGPYAVSYDGRFVTFMEIRPLVPGDTNGQSDVYVFDRSTGAVERVNVASNGAQTNDISQVWSNSISDDGRFVLFGSNASNLVPNDTNGRADLFVHDRQTGQTTRVNVASNGTQANIDTSALFSAISGDGRWVAFATGASNLVPGDTCCVDLFLHDRQTGTTTRVASDLGTDYGSLRLSTDGRILAFQSNSAVLVPGDTNGTNDVFVYDRSTGVMTRVSVSDAGVQGNGSSLDPAISGDGHIVAFDSGATNFVPNDGNSYYPDVFVVGAACGNGFLDPGEQCDDGNALSCDGCSTDCKLESGCGDGVVCGAEQCDDGNTAGADGCSATCTVEVCGNGVLDPGEQCDDGNTVGCDGCSTSCKVETGCGDGVVCGAEECDDGNTTSGDGCSATCTIEPVDVSGSWQITMDFGNGMVGTDFFTFTSGTMGSFSATEDECGSFVLAVGTGLHDVAACATSPAAVTGTAIGANFALPATGTYGIDKTVTTPFPWFTCSLLARVQVASQLHGHVETDGAGRAVRITGVMQVSDVTMKDPSGNLCLIAQGPVTSASFEMLRNEVPVGNQVTVQPKSASTITFDTVNAAGRAGITALTAPNGELPANFAVVGASIYYDVDTTASFAGEITTCLPYPDVDQNGFVDGTNPPLAEDELELRHKEGGVYVDRTVSRDPVANVVCSETSSLSPFVLGAQSSATTITTTTSSTTTTNTLAPGEQPLSGKRLTLKDNVDPHRRGITVQSIDPALGLGKGNGTIDDPVLNGASVRVRTSDGCGGPCDMTYPLTEPRAWEYIGHQGENKGYKYKAISGLVRTVTLKPGNNVKVTGKGTLGHALAASPAPVDIVLRLGRHQYCMRFGGTTTRFVPGRVFSAVTAAAPVACPP